MESTPTFINVEYLFGQLYDFLFTTTNGSTRVHETLSTLYVISYILSVILFAIILYYLYRIKQFQSIEEQKFQANFDKHEVGIHANGRWDMVIAHATSDNPAEWRIAILEADAMLDELLRELGYTGAGVGEMLQQADRGSMSTLQDAWDAHKIRNKIAHEGINFGLSENLTNKTINLYRRVFEEFGKI